MKCLCFQLITEPFSTTLSFTPASQSLPFTVFWTMSFVQDGKWYYMMLLLRLQGFQKKMRWSLSGDLFRTVAVGALCRSQQFIKALDLNTERRQSVLYSSAALLRGGGYACFLTTCSALLSIPPSLLSSSIFARQACLSNVWKFTVNILYVTDSSTSTTFVFGNESMKERTTEREGGRFLLS